MEIKCIFIKFEGNLTWGVKTIIFKLSYDYICGMDLVS